MEVCEGVHSVCQRTWSSCTALVSLQSPPARVYAQINATEGLQSRPRMAVPSPSCGGLRVRGPVAEACTPDGVLFVLWFEEFPASQ
eukprot:scaffold286407_cov33-Tisochrysis_lutea.AAC.3